MSSEVIWVLASLGNQIVLNSQSRLTFKLSFRFLRLWLIPAFRHQETLLEHLNQLINCISDISYFGQNYKLELFEICFQRVNSVIQVKTFFTS